MLAKCLVLNSYLIDIYFSVHFTTKIGDVKLSTNIVYGRNGLWITMIPLNSRAYESNCEARGHAPTCAPVWIRYKMFFFVSLNWLCGPAGTVKMWWNMDVGLRMGRRGGHKYPSLETWSPFSMSMITTKGENINHFFGASRR